MHKIIITRRGNDYHASLDGSYEMWGTGKSSDEAIGALINVNRELFDIEISFEKAGEKKEIADKENLK
jgi:hypothetical protein